MGRDPHLLLQRLKIGSHQPARMVSAFKKVFKPDVPSICRFSLDTFCQFPLVSAGIKSVVAENDRVCRDRGNNKNGLNKACCFLHGF